MKEKYGSDPPTVSDLDDLDTLVRYRLGRSLFIYETRSLPDGSIIGYLGVVRPLDTSPWPSQRELTHRNYAPIGAVRAHPNGEDYVVTLPDRDALAKATNTRIEYEDEYRAGILPSLLNHLEDRQTLHSDEAAEYDYFNIEDGQTITDLDLNTEAAFQLGRSLGMMRMASLTYRNVQRRLQTPYNGNRKWLSDEYAASRSRRSTSDTDD